MDIENLTLEEINELQNKLDSRKADLKLIEVKAKQEIAKQHIDIIKKYKDIILSLIDHDRTSCSDENPCNGYGLTSGYARCKKCYLIEILKGYYDNRFDIKLEVVIIDTEK